MRLSEDVGETIKETVPPLTEEETKKLIETVRELGLHENVKRFNDAVAQARKRLFRRKRTKAKSP
jgi:chemotaxis regulatin CheY-phosphate phosphatase CheZ